MNNAPQPLYFDCDTGIDDSMALAYLLASPEISLVGIGTVSGNVDSTQAARNTLALLELAGRPEIPVAVGEHDPLAGTFPGGVPHIHGANGIGDIEVADAQAAPEAESGPEMIVRLARAHGGRLRLLTTGPLTNIAAALELDPELPSLVQDITIMGGAGLVSGNVTPVAEANIHNDPEAAHAVLSAPWDITLVPLDVTLSHTLEESHRTQLLESERPLARALGEMLDLYFAFYVQTFGRPCCAAHDPLAAAVATGGVVASLAPRVHVSVDDTDGPGRGQTICDLRGAHQGFPDQPGARCRVVLATDTDVAAHLTERMLAL
ncbi:nucleoside hydrolase [Streptomyces sp. NPDC058686]|uniref:nucleoside hydrolase n=1 Tax=Streptomyces sp. NPDC058686 TaxID=3346599 RepID=UPI0036535771